MISILSFCRSNNLSFSLLVRIKKINIIIRKINNTVITLSKISNLYLENRLGSSLIIVASWGNDNLLISKALIFEASNTYPLGMIWGWISLGAIFFSNILKASFAKSEPIGLYLGLKPPMAQCPMPTDANVNVGILGLAVIMVYVAFPT